MIKKHM